MSKSHNSAILLIDLQNDYCHPDGVFHRLAGFDLSAMHGLQERVNRLAAAGRAAGIPIIWVRMIYDDRESVGILAERSPWLQEEGLRRSTWGAASWEGLVVHEDDIVVEKRRFSAFFKTDLEIHLHNLEIKSLLVAGVRTDFCVESTVRDAFFRDYYVTVIQDCVAGYFFPLHEHSLQLMGTVFAEVGRLDEVLSDFGKVARITTIQSSGK